MQENTTGFHNIAIGQSALANNTTGVGNIAIGPSAAGTVNANNKLYIGGYHNGTTATYNGTNALLYGDMKDKLLTVNGTFTINGAGYIQTSSGTTSKIVTEADLRGLRLHVGTGSYSLTLPSVIISDARLKNISGDNTAGLKEITQLKVKNFTYKNHLATV